MAKKRTRSQKLKAKKYQYHYLKPVTLSQPSKKISIKPLPDSTLETTVFSPHDIFKTLIISMTIIGLEFVLYWYWS